MCYVTSETPQQTKTSRKARKRRDQILTNYLLYTVNSCKIELWLTSTELELDASFSRFTHHSHLELSLVKTLCLLSANAGHLWDTPRIAPFYKDPRILKAGEIHEYHLSLLLVFAMNVSKYSYTTSNFNSNTTDEVTGV